MANDRRTKTGTAGDAPRKSPEKRLAQAGALRDERLDADVNEVLEIIADAQRSVDRQLKSLSRRTKLTPRGIFTLSLINAGLDRASLLVDYFDLLPSTMTVELDRLVEAGLIARKGDAADRRVTRLELTRKGNKFREEVMDIVNAMFLPRIAQVPKDELDACIKTLKRIVYPPSAPENA